MLLLFFGPATDATMIKFSDLFFVQNLEPLYAATLMIPSWVLPWCRRRTRIVSTRHEQVFARVQLRISARVWAPPFSMHVVGEFGSTDGPIGELIVIV